MLMGGPGSGRRKSPPLTKQQVAKLPSSQPRDRNGKFTSHKVSPKPSHGKKSGAGKKISRTIYDMIVFDFSGSMHSIARPTMEGINKYLVDLKSTSGKTGIKTSCSMIKFDDRIEVVFLDVDSKEISLLDSYPTRGSTALYDAIKVAIEKMAGIIGLTNLLNKDYDATITIFTDGHENASRTISRPEVANLINKVQKEYGWTIAFIGCGSIEQVTAVTSSLGIFASNTASYDGSSEGMVSMANTLAVSRSSKSLNYAAGKQSNIGFFSEE